MVLATLSNGQMVDMPPAVRKARKKFERLQRELSRKKKGSNRRYKARRKLARAYERVSHLRANTLHNLSSRLTENVGTLVIEDLNVAGMVKNHHLARAINEMGFAELRRQLEYKAYERGVELIVAHRFEPSSKRCSLCGNVKKVLELSERIYSCDNCGLVIPRDLNAAINLESLAANCADNSNGRGAGVSPSGASLRQSAMKRLARKGLIPISRAHQPVMG